MCLLVASACLVLPGFGYLRKLSFFWYSNFFFFFGNIKEVLVNKKYISSLVAYSYKGDPRLFFWAFIVPPFSFSRISFIAYFSTLNILMAIHCNDLFIDRDGMGGVGAFSPLPPLYADVVVKGNYFSSAFSLSPYLSHNLFFFSGWSSSINLFVLHSVDHSLVGILIISAHNTTKQLFIDLEMTSFCFSNIYKLYSFF